jgi:predicted nucleic acid-binding protein
MAMTPTNNADTVVVDASILVSMASNEAGTHLLAEAAFNHYSQNGWEFFAPNVIVSEVLFALCQKLISGVLTRTEYEQAIDKFLLLMQNISTETDDQSLVKRAVEIWETYGCSRSSDSLYLALAEDLAKSRTVELLTFDKGIINQAAKNAPTVTIKVL